MRGARNPADCRILYAETNRAGFHWNFQRLAVPRPSRDGPASQHRENLGSWMIFSHWPRRPKDRGQEYQIPEAKAEGTTSLHRWDKYV